MRMTVPSRAVAGFGFMVSMAFVALMLGCAGSATPRTAARESVDGDAAPGDATACSTAALPTWRYETVGHRVALSTGNIAFKLPLGWSARLEKPQLVVVSAPERIAGVLPVFEIFVTPTCKQRFDSRPIHRRVAARGFAGILSPDEIAAQLRAGRWPAGLGGRVGRGLVLDNVIFQAPSGERTVTLWETAFGDTTTFSIHAASVCPQIAGATPASNTCVAAYFDMLESAK